MQMAARGMREDARRNAFVGTLSVLQTMMQFGYYLGVIPFRVVFDGTKYVMVTSRPRQVRAAFHLRRLLSQYFSVFVFRSLSSSCFWW
jgi:hypothetical protein